MIFKSLVVKGERWTAVAERVAVVSERWVVKEI